MKYKFLRLKRGKLCSDSGNLTWKIGEWVTHKGKLLMCNSGLHCSKTPYQAFSFVQGEVLAIVEVKGKHLIETDKECWEKMRIVKAYKWTKKDSVAFAIYGAESVLKYFEEKYPNDLRPRQAIEAAKKVLFKDTAKNRAAAGAAAEAARAAARAVWAAEAAAGAAGAARAVWAAVAAAGAGVWAAGAAAWAARAAEAAVYKKLSTWMVKRIKELEEL